MNKACKICGTEFPADTDHFFASRTTRDGLQVYCKECHRAKNRAWRKNNPDRARELRRQWMADPVVAERERLRHRREREADPDKHRLKVRISYYKHREQRTAARRDYAAANRARESAARTAWRKRHPLKDKMTAARTRARRLGCDISPVVPERVIARRGLVCGICGGRVAMNDLVFDHIVPLSSRGAHAEDNLQVAHYECNRAKSAAVGGVHKGKH